MNIIHNYVESMFSNVPETSEMEQLKEDILANMEDKYQELLEEGKSKNEAIGTVISEFGNIDEILEEFNIYADKVNLDDLDSGESGTLPVVDRAEAERYMASKRKAGLFVGFGVMCCLFGVAIANLSRESILEKGFPDVWNIVVLLVFVSIGVACFIYAGFQLSPFKYMEKKFILKPEVRSEIEQRRSDYRASFMLSTTLGVVLCILSIIPTLITELGGNQRFESVGHSLLLVIVSFGVFLFCYGGNIQSSFTILLENGLKKQPTEKEIKKSRALQVFDSIYWPLMVAAYLLWSFLGDAWNISWIIFPICGVIGGGIQTLLSNDDK